MKPEVELRILIRGRLASGLLPRDECSKIWGGPANGETCDGCDGTVEKTELLMECIGEGYPRSHTFHVVCFYLWDSERKALGAEPRA